MRINPTNPVRRCLFPADHDDESRTDNLANAFRESLDEDLKEKTKKYNYDFKNDRPLEGSFMWFEGDGRYDMIGVRRIEDTEEVESPASAATESEGSEVDETEDISTRIQRENEATPKAKEDDSAPPVRKRKNDEDGNVGRQNVTVVKRRLYD